MANTQRVINQTQKDFVSEIESMSQSYSVVDKFRDAVRCMAIALHGPVLSSAKERQDGEDEYMTYVKKYGNDGMSHVAKAFSIVVDALECRREDFLGNVLETVGAANVHNGQFLTPSCVARMMARVTMPKADGAVHEDGAIVTLNDPSCGASVTLIEGAEELVQNQHVPQRDIMIYAEDIDFNAFNMSYVQLSLLGYAARVTHVDSLSLQVYGGPWYTPGYMLHGMPMRLAHKASENQDHVNNAEYLQGELGI